MVGVCCRFPARKKNWSFLHFQGRTRVTSDPGVRHLGAEAGGGPGPVGAPGPAHQGGPGEAQVPRRGKSTDLAEKWRCRIAGRFTGGHQPKVLEVLEDGKPRTPDAVQPTRLRSGTLELVDSQLRRPSS